MNYLNQSESAQRRHERDRQLTELYCEVFDKLKAKRVKNLRQVALSIALETGTPRYHVGFDRAYAVVPKLLSGKRPINFKSNVNREMWLDLTEKVKCLMCEGKMSAAQAITIVLEQCRASRFYLTPTNAWIIIKRQLSMMNCRRPYGRAA